jgi:hypothetical protein
MIAYVLVFFVGATVGALIATGIWMLKINEMA